MPTDSSLNHENLSAVFKNVPNEKWDNACQVLRIPYSMQAGIQESYDSDAERKEAVIMCYITYHPSPNWEHVARVLQGIGERNLAEMVTKKYILGKNSSLKDTHRE